MGVIVVTPGAQAGVDEAVVREIIPKLKSFGAEGIVEYPLNKVVL